MRDPLQAGNRPPREGLLLLLLQQALHPGIQLLDSARVPLPVRKLQRCLLQAQVRSPFRLQHLLLELRTAPAPLPGPS